MGARGARAPGAPLDPLLPFIMVEFYVIQLGCFSKWTLGNQNILLLYLCANQRLQLFQNYIILRRIKVQNSAQKESQYKCKYNRGSMYRWVNSNDVQYK